MQRKREEEERRREELKAKKLQEIEEKKKKREAKAKKVAENQAALKEQEQEKKNRLKVCWDLLIIGGHRSFPPYDFLTCMEDNSGICLISSPDLIQKALYHSDTKFSKKLTHLRFSVTNDNF